MHLLLAPAESGLRSSAKTFSSSFGPKNVFMLYFLLLPKLGRFGRRLFNFERRKKYVSLETLQKVTQKFKLNLKYPPPKKNYVEKKERKKQSKTWFFSRCLRRGVFEQTIPVHPDSESKGEGGLYKRDGEDGGQNFLVLILDIPPS